MKKSLTFIISLTLALPSVANAASFIVTPSTGSYYVGDTIALDISVRPDGKTIYATVLNASFSPDVFEVVSFSMNDAILPLKMPGYDTADNISGVLIKSGGYAGGTKTTVPYGKLVLRAKSSGTGTFTVQDASKLLDANDADLQEGTQTISFIIATASSPSMKTRGASQGTTSVKSKIDMGNAATSTTSVYSRQLAAAGEFIVSSLGILIILIILICIFVSWRYAIKGR